MFLFFVSRAEEEDMPSSEQGTSGSTKRTSLSQGISVTSNPEERHIPTVESKTYPDEEEDEESLEKIMFQSNQTFKCFVPVLSKRSGKTVQCLFTFLPKMHP